jgi:large subunit ribosomal protein L25
MERHNLTASIRVEKGKQAAKKLRNEKRIPATLYGQGNEPVMLSVSSSDLNRIMKTTTGENIILNLQIESAKGADNRMVMLKELQVNHIKDTLIHADFLGISMDKEITLDIPIRLINTPKGAIDGGILQQARREISIACLPGNVVEQIDIDISGLDIGDSIHIGDIVLPEGIRCTLEDNLAVAMVLAPALSKEEKEGEGLEEEAGKEGAEAETAD